MRFFTMDWWVSCQDWESKPDLEGPSRAYTEYVTSIARSTSQASRGGSRLRSENFAERSVFMMGRC